MGTPLLSTSTLLALATLATLATLVFASASSEESLRPENIVTTPNPANESRLAHNKVDLSDPDALNKILQLSEEDLSNDLEGWETPTEIAKNYIYYLSGFDYEDCPIWIVEMGKYDMRKVVAGGKESMEAFDNFTRQAALRIYKSHKLRDESNSRVSYIIDFEGLKLNQLTDIRTVTYILKLASEWGEALARHTRIVLIVNANYITEFLINLVKPVLGGILTHAEVFGGNRERWIPRLLREFPKDQIPEWYGGHKGFTPISVYG